jgi:hypothetical protein
MKNYMISFAILLAITFAAWAAFRTHETKEQAALQKGAKITMVQARKTALTKEFGTIKSQELEKENDKLIYSFDIQTKSGIQEVNVDAISGDVVEDQPESAAVESKEIKNRSIHMRPPAPSANDGSK